MHIVLFQSINILDLCKEDDMCDKVSDKAKRASKRFIENIKNGKIRKDVLPNNAPPFTEEEEKKEYEHFCKFAESELYKKLVS